MNKKVNIELSKNEAIVLFDFLGRFNKQKRKNLFEDQAEQRVLWDIECILENELPEPFLPEYPDIVTQAREQVRDKK